MAGAVKKPNKSEQRKIMLRLIGYVHDVETEETVEKLKSCLDVVEDIDSIRDSNDSNNTLLHIAVISGNLGQVKVLLERGGSVTTENDEGETPLSLAETGFLQPGCSSEVEEIHRLLSSKATELSLMRQSISGTPGEGKDSIGCATKNVEEIYSEAPIKERHKVLDLDIDVESDNVESLAFKMKVDVPQNQENILLKEEVLEYLNRPLDSEGNTILMKFARQGEADVVEFLLKFEGLQVNATNRNGETAADYAYRWNKNICLLRLLEADSVFPKYFGGEKSVEETETGWKELRQFIARRLALHDHIKAGDLESIKEHTKSCKSSFYFNISNKSAVYCAAKKGEFEICAYLQFLGVKFRRDERTKLKNKIEIDEQNQLLAAASIYFIEDECSHVHNLLASSKVYGVFSDERREIVASLYKKLNECRYIAIIMKVLKNEDVDVIFDFDSNEVDRIRPNTEEDTYGLADSEIRRIYVGAKACVSEKSPDNGVLGTLAHELTHLAMQAVYGNYAKPYKGDETAKKNEYKDVVSVVERACNEKPKDIDEVITIVFDYEEWALEAELIVRVPHILGMYGETEGMRLLRNQVPELLDFYTQSVIPDCEMYTENTFFEKPLCLIESLQKSHGLIQEMEEGIPPLRKLNEKFEDTLNSYDNISILVTSNTKLCSWHVYNELKDIFQFHMNKCCLFFELKRFESNWKSILNAFNCKACKYLVLLTDDLFPNFIYTSRFFQDVEDTEEKKVILIVNEECNTLQRDWKHKAIRYNWNHLSIRLKHKLLEKMVDYQGKQVELGKIVNEAMATQLIDPELVSCLIKEENIRFGGGNRLFSQGYSKDCYIERSFVRETVNETIFRSQNENYYLFLTGVMKGNLHRYGIDYGNVQILHREDDPLQEGKSIILADREEIARKTFGIICEREQRASIHWLHLMKNAFYHRMSKGGDGFMQKYLEEEFIDEDNLTRTSRENKARVVLICGDAGSGKSTVISDLIRKTKGPDVWVARVNFNDYAVDSQNPNSLENINKEGKAKDIIDYFIGILNLKSPLELPLVKSFMKSDCRLIVYFDGFDEISPFYKEKALKLLVTLKDETRIQIWVTSRMHEKVDLECELGVISYRMRACSSEDQTSYLGKYWLIKLRSSCREVLQHGSKGAIEKIREIKIEGIIAALGQSLAQGEDRKILEPWISFKNSMIYDEDRSEERQKKQLQDLESMLFKLDFTSLARVFLDRMSYSINDEKNQFTGLPLHLNMMAEVSYHDNWKIEKHSDMYHLYSHFVEKKVEIQLKEKCGITLEKPGNIEWSKREKQRIFEDHWKIAMSVISPDRYPLDSINKRKLIENNHRIGLMREVENGQLQFSHRTFAEYFFSESIVESILQDRLDKGMMKDILLKSEHQVVSVFINSKLQSMKDEISFGKNFYKDFHVNDVFFRYFSYAKNEDFKNTRHIWEGVLWSLEQNSDKESMNEFLSKITDRKFELHREIIMEFVHLLGGSLSNLSLTKIFNSNEFIIKILFQHILEVSAKDIQNIFHLVQGVTCYNARQETLNLGSITSQQLDTEVMNRTNEINKESNKIERTKRLLEVRNVWNIFYYALHNKDEKVLPLLVAFFKGIVGKDVLMEQITNIDNYGNSILHKFAIENRLRQILTEMRSTLEKETFDGLIGAGNNKGENFLHNLAQHTTSNEFKLTLSCLGECIDTRLMRELLLQRCGFGRTVLHSASLNEDIGIFKEILQVAKCIMSQEELKKYAMSGDKYGRTVFHMRAFSRHPIRDLGILKEHISGENMRELIGKGDINGETCLHERASGYFSLKELIIDDIKSLKEVFDSNSLEKFLSRGDEDGDTFLHSAAENEDIRDYSGILGEIRNILSETFLLKLINTKNNIGEVVREIEEDGIVKLRKVELQ